MTLSVDLFWSMRSPYCYLAADRIVKMSQDYDLDVNVRILYPTALRDKSFHKEVNPNWIPYFMRDFVRVADYLGLPCKGWPNPDPVQQDIKTLQIAEDQPYIHRLVHFGIEANKQGRGLDYVQAVSHLIFGSNSDWSAGSLLPDAVAKAGLDLAELDAGFDANFAAREEIIDENQTALDAAGHWGVPTLVFEGEPFFGQDRVDMCLWRMKKAGLKGRI